VQEGNIMARHIDGLRKKELSFMQSHDYVLEFMGASNDDLYMGARSASSITSGAHQHVQLSSHRAFPPQCVSRCQRILH
jgi:hypothetical protein